MIECGSFVVEFENLTPNAYNLTIKVQDEFGNNSSDMVSWIIEEFYPQLQVNDTIDTNLIINIQEGSFSDEIGVFLSASPLENEIVSLECKVTDQRLSVIGLPMIFNHENYQIQQFGKISVASNQITYDGGLAAISCSCLSSFTTGGNYSNSTSIINVDVLIIDVASPFFDDIQVLLTNSSLSSITSTGFSLSIAGNEMLQIQAAVGVEFREGMIVKINDRIMEIVSIETSSCIIQLSGKNDFKEKLGSYVPISIELPSSLNSIGKAVLCPSDCPGDGGSGLFVTEKCIGDKWIDGGSECFEPKTAHLCGLGNGHECQECPSGGICPGGYRIWPFPLYWSANEFSYPESCKLPEIRCQGWDVSESVSICGEGYEGLKCETCVSGYYMNSQKLCLECPSGGLLEHILPLIYLVMFILLLFFVWLLLVLIVQHRFGGTFKAGFQRAMQFSIWATLSLQFVGQIVRTHHDI
eukprot:TRINITY_DN4949_c0_g1_i1.p1 TRINITY_DN4949_c0_g1~~TRINITY_DN4949_c0_g1_i1.p1  ORF type:complete len:489 (+),score=94.79 TRINITY_DN4949_c0_g1_i1:64-1467(+)